VNRSVWDRIALVLLIIGALNWGMVGFFQMDVVAAIFGSAAAAASRVIYVIIGLAGIYGIALLFRERETVREPQQ